MPKTVPMIRLRKRSTEVIHEVLNVDEVAKDDQ